MIVTLAPDVPDGTRSAIVDAAALIGSGARELTWEDGVRVVAIDGDLPANVLSMPGVAASYDKHKNYMLASKLVIEDRESTIAIAREARAKGAVMLRGGAYKPRTSPYAFQGLGEVGLEHLAAARDDTGLPVVTEVMEPDQVDLVAHYADMLQVGA